MKLLRFVLLGALFVGACLEPPEDDAVPPELFYGDPNVEPAMVTHVEDDPTYAANVEQFASSVAYLRGFADGEAIWYWNVDGPNATFIAPLYRIIGADGQPIGRAIIDVIPGDAGYTPWWRIFEVRVTDRYDGERIWSRAAIDAGIRAGILEEPVATTTVVNCPVARRDTVIPVSTDEGDVESTKWVWYRDRRIDWVVFTDRISVPTDERTMPLYPVYILQRINQGAPIYEFVTGVDVTGDNVLNDSNNIFASGLDGPRYSPLWYVAIVRVEADYMSVDTSTAGRAVDLDAETDFYDPIAGEIVSDQVVPPIARMREALVNCPVQRVRGQL